jgi:glycosyltransferase involved in cell wall biosynthesis
VQTGFVSEVGKILGTMSAVICPWKGRYGFRSRFVEAMAVGVPIITTEDGMWGMGLERNKEIVLAATAAEFSEAIVRILRDREWAQAISRGGRAKVEEAFTFEATYLQAFRRLAATSPAEPGVL